MSLWYKGLDKITGADVVAFCDLCEKEGLRLDYKKEIPKGLAKIVAAFANTRGGLVLLGVKANKTENTPVRPLVGMAKDIGIEEKITSMCLSKIYPPVEFEISPVLDNPEAPDTGFVVIRVPESPEAPHSIDGKVYERVTSQNDGIEFIDHAHIANIRHLLERRANTERVREEAIKKEIRRALVQLGPSRNELREMVRLLGHSPEEMDIPLLPLRWFSAIPLYPWRNVCTPAACHTSLVDFLDEPGGRLQRVPGGTHTLRFHPGSLPRKVPMGYVSTGCLGHIFEAELPIEPGSNLKWKKDQIVKDPTQCFFLDFKRSHDLAMKTLERARHFFGAGSVEKPGYLQLTLGILDAFRFRMYDNNTAVPEELRRSGGPYIDEHFQASVTVPYAQFETESLKAMGSLLTELEFGFDRPTAGIERRPWES